jgi:hypothetical protein
MKREKPAPYFLSLILISMAGPLLPAWGSDSAEESLVRRPKLQIINGSDQKISVFWLKSATERISNGTVDPSKDNFH